MTIRCLCVKEESDIEHSTHLLYYFICHVLRMILSHSRVKRMIVPFSSPLFFDCIHEIIQYIHYDMIHNPSMMLYGQASELEQGIDFLNEVKESIINAYQIKTGLSRSKLSHLMDGETWMNAHSAHDMGFCDKILYGNDDSTDNQDMIFDKTTMVTNTIAAMRKKLKPIVKPEDSKYCIPSEQFETRLNLLK